MPAVPVIPSQAVKAAGASASKDGPAKTVISKENLASKPGPSSFSEPVPKPKSNKDSSSADSIGPTKGAKLREAALSGEEKDAMEIFSKIEEAAGKDKKASGRRLPGKLNIEATRTAMRDEAEVSKQAQDTLPASSTTVSAISQPQTPVTAASQASGAGLSKASQPRTIRVIQASKSETPPKGSAATPSKDSTNAGSANLPSRRGSLSSLHLPGTPAEERISDNVSMTSASMSRADSPPPSKIGTAPVRHATKSQQKKERQARAKQLEEVTKAEEPLVKAPVEEPIQAPIIGRKKKQKKPASRGTADSTPAVTRPSSPLLHGESIPEQEGESVPTTPAKDVKRDETKESELDTPLSPAPISTTADQPQQPRNTLTAATLFAQLQRTQEVPQGALDIFKSVMGLNHRFDNIDPNSLDQMPEITLGLPPPLTEAQNAQIDNGEPVCVDQPNNRRIIVLPDRRTLRGLTPDQASRYLTLRTQALITTSKLYSAGHGPAPPRTPNLLLSNNHPTSTPFSSSTTTTTTVANKTLTAYNAKHLPNPFLEPSSSSNGSSSSSQPSIPASNTNTTKADLAAARLPQAFGSSASANPTTYVDEAAVFIANRRRGGGGGGDGAEAAAARDAGDGGGGFGVSVEDAESALGASRRETEGLEKRLKALLRRNRRM
ncbi:MAG: hypothetical protein LQ352_005149, partial [Teloschistes flavicans]